MFTDSLWLLNVEMTYDSNDEYILLFPAPDICQSKNVFCNQPHGSCLAQPQTNQTECVCHVGYKNSPQCLPGNFFTMIVDLKSWFLHTATKLINQYIKTIFHTTWLFQVPQQATEKMWKTTIF